MGHCDASNVPQPVPDMRGSATTPTMHCKVPGSNNIAPTMSASVKFNSRGPLLPSLPHVVSHSHGTGCLVSQMSHQTSYCHTCLPFPPLQPLHLVSILPENSDHRVFIRWLRPSFFFLCDYLLSATRVARKISPNKTKNTSACNPVDKPTGNNGEDRLICLLKTAQQPKSARPRGREPCPFSTFPESVLQTAPASNETDSHEQESSASQLLTCISRHDLFQDITSRLPLTRRPILENRGHIPRATWLSSSSSLGTLLEHTRVTINERPKLYVSPSNLHSYPHRHF